MKTIKLIAHIYTDIPDYFTGIVEWDNGDKEGFNDFKVHRVAGPAIEKADGSKFWFVDGKRHRLDGPATELSDGTKEWYVDHVKVTEADYLQAVLLYKCKMVLES